MKLFIDIGHPAHVHYFRNFIKGMEARGNSVFISARNRNIIHYLLIKNQIAFYDRGKGKSGPIGKLLYMFIADIRLLIRACSFRPDIFISFASPYAAQVAWLLRKPHIALDDTEHARFGQWMYKVFSTDLLNPDCFYKDFGKKQIRLKTFTELFYLHDKYYSPDRSVLDRLKLKSNEKYIVIRLVSWDANHDMGQSGLSRKTILEIIQILKGRYRIFVSNENLENDFLEEFKLHTPYEAIHDVLYFSELLISESGTMASEAALLGTPVIYINSLPLMGYLKEESEAGLLKHFANDHGVSKEVRNQIVAGFNKQNTRQQAANIKKGKIDPTSFLIWFVENYPESKRIMSADPEFQTRF
jgi:hypothetical protein